LCKHGRPVLRLGPFCLRVGGRQGGPPAPGRRAFDLPEQVFEHVGVLRCGEMLFPRCENAGGRPAHDGDGGPRGC